MLTFRDLPAAEWPNLLRDGIEPFATFGLPPNPDHWRMVVAEEDGRIMALSSLRNEVLNDWWIHPDAQHSPTLVSGLWLATKAVLDDAGVSRIHATVSDAQPEVQYMVERLGYIPAGGKLYLLYVPDAILNERG
jgi:hypothetical protein